MMNLMEKIGFKADKLKDISRVIIQMNDGSWVEFDSPQIVKVSLKERMMITIKGAPKRVVDLAGAFDLMYPERCKYLDPRWFE